MHTVTSAGESEPSNEVRLHVGVPVAPSPPENLLGMVNGSALALAWKNTFEGGPPSNTILDVTGSSDDVLVAGRRREFFLRGGAGGHLYVERAGRERRRYERRLQRRDAHVSRDMLWRAGDARELPRLSNRQHDLRAVGSA